MASRHPVNGYRIYRLKDLETLVKSPRPLMVDKRSTAPKVDWSAIAEREHFVQFYERKSGLVSAVAAYAAEALKNQEAVLIIAKPEHREGIQNALRRKGVNLKVARKRSQYLELDAEQLLSKFMVKSSPDSARFEETIGKTIQQLNRKWSKVRAFGEMVAVLWAEGNRKGACELEALWNELAKRHTFSLFCAYPIAGFCGDSEGGPRLEDVCATHSLVIPAESYSSLASKREQLRKVTQLQREAQLLKLEAAKRAEAERELSDFVENAIEALHKVGPDGTVIWANKAELELLGYAADEYIGHHIGEFHVNPTILEDILRRLSSGENLLNYAAQLRCKNGSIKHVLIHSNAKFKDGEFQYSRCFTRDVTHIREHEIDRARLASIVDSSEDAIISKNLDGIIQSWNSGAEKLFGYTAQEAIGQPNTLIIPNDRRQEEAQILDQIRQGQRIEHFETVRITKDGQPLDMSLTVSPVLDRDGQVVGASKIGRNITERKKAESQLRKSEERLRRLLALLPVGVYTCEAPTGRLTYWNGQATKLWGREPKPGDTAERYCGAHKLYKPDGTYLPHSECPMAVAVTKGLQFRNMEVQIERPDASRITALVNIDPIYDDARELVGAINVFQDITVLKDAERQLKDADRRKDEFLATLAHELRNPLAPIRNSLYILRMAGQNPDAAARVHDMMERQIMHLIRLVDDLLEVSRISRGKIELRKEHLILSSVLNQAIETSKPVIEASKHNLELVLPKEPVHIEGDVIRLSQVFSNLLNNAAKYMNIGGNIKIFVTPEVKDVRISVRDTGIGIPPEMLTRVFEMFVQVDNPLRQAHDGLGIGLSLVKSLVEMHGGEVSVHSEGIGKGSEFTVRLPLAQTNPETVQFSCQRGVLNSKGIRVLVVDDNADAAESLGMMLKLLGADVKIAFDAKSALEIIKAVAPTVVFMDIGMPHVDGCTAAKMIRSEPANNDVVLIALTGWGQEEDRRRTMEAGFNQHLVKPVDIDDIQSVLAAISCEPSNDIKRPPLRLDSH